MCASLAHSYVRVRLRGRPLCTCVVLILLSAPSTLAVSEMNRWAQWERGMGLARGRGPHWASPPPLFPALPRQVAPRGADTVSTCQTQATRGAVTC